MTNTGRQRIYYDLHIHSCLSPCADNDMTPNNIVNMAVLCGLELIAVTDHNCCANCAPVISLARERGILALPGMELCTSEECHVVCLFSDVTQAGAFERVVMQQLPPIQNQPRIFGEQLVMNERDEIIGIVDTMLSIAADISIDDVTALVRQFGGAAFPAHIDRPSYSVTAALGTVPDVGFSAVEITANGDAAALAAQYELIADMPLLLNSDAHSLEIMKDAAAWIDLEQRTPESLIEALNGKYTCSFGRSRDADV